MNPDITLTIGAENLADATFKEILNMLQALSRQINMIQGEEISLEQTTNNLRQAGARMQLDSNINMPQLLSKLGQITDALGQFDVKLEDVSGRIHSAAGTSGADFDQFIKNIFPDPNRIQTYLKSMALDIAGTSLQFDTGATAPSSHSFNIGGRTTNIQPGKRTEKQLLDRFNNVREDCIVRAMAIGMGLAYDDLHAHLEKTQKMNPQTSRLYERIGISRNPDLGVHNIDYEPVLQAAGFKPLKVTDSSRISRKSYSGPRFKDLVDELVKTEVGRNLSLLVSSPKHMGAISAGSLQDAWDSSKEPISEIFIREEDLNLPEVKKALENISKKVGKTLQNIIDAGSFVEAASLASYEEFRGVQERKERSAREYVATAKPAKATVGGEAPKVAKATAQAARSVDSAAKNVQSSAKNVESAAKSVENTAREVRKAAAEIKGAAQGGGVNPGKYYNRDQEAWRRLQAGETFKEIRGGMKIPERDLKNVLERNIFQIFEKQTRSWAEDRIETEAQEIFDDLGIGGISGLAPRYMEELVKRGLQRVFTDAERTIEATQEAEAKMAEKRSSFELSDEQKEVIDAPFDRPLIVDAGPGTGKTKILVDRIKKLVKEMQAAGVDNPFDRVMVGSHSNAAVDELRKRLEDTFGAYNVARMRLGTWHKLGLGMMQKNRDPSTVNYRAYVDFPEQSGWAEVRNAAIARAEGRCEGPG